MVGRGRRDAGLASVNEGYARLLAVTPLHFRAQRLLLLRDVKIDYIRHVHGSREDKPRAGGRNVAHEAVDGRAVVVEIDAAAQEAFLPRRLPAFRHDCLSFRWPGA